MEGLVSDMWELRRCAREGRAEASVRSFAPQKLTTSLEHELFH